MKTFLPNLFIILGVWMLFSVATGIRIGDDDYWFALGGLTLLSIGTSILIDRTSPKEKR